MISSYYTVNFVHSVQVHAVLLLQIVVTTALPGHGGTMVTDAMHCCVVMYLLTTMYCRRVELRCPCHPPRQRPGTSAGSNYTVSSICAVCVRTS
jgi:hypothetical protein